MAEIFAYSAIFLYLCTRKMGFRSSVGLEQRPSKAWVLGSNPNGITFFIQRLCQNEEFDAAFFVSKLKTILI